MKYFTLQTVIQAYQANTKSTKNKFWGLLSILHSIDSIAQPKISYNLDTSKVSALLEELFCIDDNKKPYQSTSFWSVMFSRVWAKKAAELMLSQTPNIYDIAAWYYRRTGFQDNATSPDIIKMLLESLHIEERDAKELFDFHPKEFSFSKDLYCEKDLFKTLGASSTNITAEGGTTVAHPGELSRAPFIQTLYAGQSLMECLIITQFQFNDLYKDKATKDCTRPLINADCLNNEIINLLNEKRNIILTGAPGTGKTFTAKAIASYIVSDGKSDWKGLTEEQKKQVGFVQFHPSYDYTDFVEGLRPIAGGEFRRQDGVFKAFCKRAISPTTNESSTGSDANLLTAKYESSNTQQDKPAKDELSGDNKYVFIIDEINRGELSKIFGELFYAIEPDYRGKAGTVQTQYNNLVEDDDVFKPGFYIPENVYIIGTMNDIDRGVEAMDFAIRRRFAWKEVTAEESAENMGITGLALEKMKALNKALMENGLSRACCIGGAYFRKLEDNDYDSLWKYHLEGIVYEYFRGEPDAEEKLQVVKEAFEKANLPTSEETYNVQEETEEDLAE